jgi:hypothetical protein
MLLFFLFFGLRGYLDTDFSIYYPIYEETPTLWDWDGILRFFSLNNTYDITRIEPGYKIYLMLLKSISSNYIIVQITSSLIDVFLINYFFKKYSAQYALSFILFLLFSGIILEINLLRNSKSIFIFLYSIQYIKERKIAKYYICNIIALLFHSSSIFFFPLYFFLHKKLPKVVIWSVFIIGNIVYILQIQYITPIISAIASSLGETYATLFDIYSSSDSFSSGYGITIGFIERFFTYILLFLSYNRINKYFKDNSSLNIFYNSFFIYFVSYTFLSEYSVFIDRITTLFSFSYWILYTYLFSIYKSNYRRIFVSILFIFAILKLYKSNNIIIRKYENIIFGVQSFEEAQSRLYQHIDKIFNNE